MDDPARGRGPASRWLIALVASALVGCGGAVPQMTATPSSPVAGSIAPASPPPPSIEARLAEVEAAVQRLRELETADPVPITFLDAEAYRARTAASLAAAGRDTVATGDDALRLLGLLGADESLLAPLLDLLAATPGSYDEVDRRIYLVTDGGPLTPFDRALYAHEFTHALQDRHLALQPVGRVEPVRTDPMAAFRALVEGDAQLVQDRYERDVLSESERADLMREAVARSVEDAAVPSWMIESFAFPYVAGEDFVEGRLLGGGWAAVNAMYADPPTTTEQVLHPHKYLLREEAVVVTLPADLASRLGAGWTSSTEDTLGELLLRLWLRAVAGVGANEADEAAAGWGGDRLAFVEGPAGAHALILDTAWDRVRDADEFAAVAGAALTRLGGDRRVGDLLQPGTERVVVILASDVATLRDLARAAGLSGQ